MKQTKLRILSALLAVLLLLGLAACGKAEPSDPNKIKIGPYELFYKGAKIMTDYDGNDAIVVTLDYTNNSKAERHRADGRHDLPLGGFL